MSKSIRCKKCRKHLGELAVGTRIRNGVVFYCFQCDYILTHPSPFDSSDPLANVKDSANLKESLTSLFGMFNKKEKQDEY